ncbi:hypothetical protein M427DRAFT_65762 [Gonapodya prolifera JEL478]|uniref:SH3 domain-containing protein n=1 Tax=Gonapodya prolifera (strain JEL478) TaxID=1344416 RepID=A0A139AZB9_GONPJ|nr:hypothetical protein M427DRAFT_65762 [Gonapodya prolifera JEL478]|eukprot:KXS21825.1 hypothetical protein M427DRAFT_65762 [Gonapodya prolifera JEL478]
MSSADDLLFAAVEAGSLPLTRTALEGGANPNARKHIVVAVGIPPPPTRNRWSFFTTIKDEPLEKCEDVAGGESVLAIAIRDGEGDIVEELLKAGSDPNDKIAWKVPGSVTSSSWSRGDWEKRRWLCSYSFDNALEFALEAGILSHKFNKRGSRVVAKNPVSGRSAYYETYSLTPSLDMVHILLKHGARCGQHTLDRAQRLTDQRFREILSAHLLSSQNGDLNTTGHGKQSSHSPPPPPYQAIACSGTNLSSLQERLTHLEETLKARETKISLLETTVTNLTSALSTFLSPADPKRVVIASTNFSERTPDEVTFVPGDVLVCASTFADGWAYGANLTSSRKGYFPVRSIHRETESTRPVYYLFERAIEFQIPTAPPLSPATSDGGSIVADLPGRWI